MTATRESDLAALRKLADEMAKGRAERVTTGHVLAAIASTSGGAADLLKERRLDAEVLLKAARIFGDDDDERRVPGAAARARAGRPLAVRARPAPFTCSSPSPGAQDGGVPARSRSAGPT